MARNVVLDLAGGIALLLWGMHMVQTGVMRAFGSDLRRILAVALGNRLSAFLLGIGITGILQSSTATGLMVTAFAASGFVTLVPALAVTRFSSRPASCSRAASRHWKPRQREMRTSTAAFRVGSQMSRLDSSAATLSH